MYLWFIINAKTEKMKNHKNFNITYLSIDYKTIKTVKVGFDTTNCEDLKLDDLAHQAVLLFESVFAQGIDYLRVLNVREYAHTVTSKPIICLDRFADGD